MIRRDITPIAELGQRAPEAGRIRMGVKSGNAMKSIDTLRFTSPDRQIIEQIANRYGGTAKEWNDPKANPSHQFEVITTSKEVRVLLIPNGLSTSYELWSGGGCQRRCDGVECLSPQKVGPDYEMVTQPCLCRAQNTRACAPYTRLQVVLPEFSFLGVWRLETKGWNAAEELPGMFNLLASCAQRGVMLDAILSVERRERVTPAGKRNFVVPRLAVRNTVLEMAAGGGTLQLEPGATPTYTMPALAAVPEVIEAEVIDDELLEIESLLEEDADNFGLEREPFVNAIKIGSNQDRARMRNASARMRAGEIIPIGFSNGRLQWKST